jgi:ABC-type Na+ efflux pump permease subunit
MNLGIILVGLMLVSASVLAIVMIASQNQTVYEDNFGAVQGNQTNDTQSIVTNTTAPLMAAGGGVVLVVAVFLLFAVAVVLIGTAKSSYGGRR